MPLNLKSAREQFQKKVPVNRPELPVNMYFLPAGLWLPTMSPKRNIVALNKWSTFFPFKSV